MPNSTPTFLLRFYISFSTLLQPDFSLDFLSSFSTLFFLGFPTAFSHRPFPLTFSPIFLLPSTPTFFRPLSPLALLCMNKSNETNYKHSRSSYIYNMCPPTPWIIKAYKLKNPCPTYLLFLSFNNFKKNWRLHHAPSTFNKILRKHGLPLPPSRTKKNNTNLFKVFKIYYKIIKNEK